jgi:hypothetical protein
MAAVGLPLTGIGSSLAQGTFRVPQQAFGLVGGGLGQTASSAFLRRTTSETSSVTAALRLRSFAFRS